MVTDPAGGRRFVAARVAEGMDYIKVIVDPPAARSVPTLVMMAAVAAAAPRPGLDSRFARGAVTALHAAGVPIVLGTDANQAQGVPANVPYGESAHRELELLVAAGLTPAEALHAATGAAADRFGLPTADASRRGCGPTYCWSTAIPSTTSQPPDRSAGCGWPGSRTHEDRRPPSGQSRRQT